MRVSSGIRLAILLNLSVLSCAGRENLEGKYVPVSPVVPNRPVIYDFEKNGNVRVIYPDGRVDQGAYTENNLSLKVGSKRYSISKGQYLTLHDVDTRRDILLCQYQHLKSTLPGPRNLRDQSTVWRLSTCDNFKGETYVEFLSDDRMVYTMLGADTVSNVLKWKSIQLDSLDFLVCSFGITQTFFLIDDEGGTIHAKVWVDTSFCDVTFERIEPMPLVGLPTVLLGKWTCSSAYPRIDTPVELIFDKGRVGVLFVLNDDITWYNYSVSKVNAKVMVLFRNTESPYAPTNIVLETTTPWDAVITYDGMELRLQR